MAVIKCPKCNNEIDEEKVYCSVCGYDIQMVPDFDARIEIEMDEALSSLLKDINLDELSEEEVANISKTYDMAATREMKERILRDVTGRLQNVKKQEQEATPSEPVAKESIISKLPAKVKSHIKWVIAAVVIIVIAGIISLTSGVIRTSISTDDMLEKAETAIDKENQEQAMAYLNDALAQEPDNMQAYLLMGRAYLLTDDVENANLYIKPAIAEGNAEGYRILTEYYISKGEYQSIAAVLRNCTDEGILYEYGSYVANPPFFNMEEGEYQQSIELTLVNDRPGHIYYTMDGTEPDDNSSEYSKPIILDSGKYIIRAVFVNERGIKSESISKIYDIASTIPDEPAVVPQSGEYNSGQYIEVSVPENAEYKVYYTTDGTMPDENSLVYEGVLLMPVGKSSYKFAAIDETGKRSNITSVQYELIPNAFVKADVAENFCITSLTATGYLSDLSGLGVDGRIYSYECIGVCADKNGDNYVVAEMTGNDGSYTYTGKYYGVNVLTGVLQKAYKSEDGHYSFAPFS